MKNNLCTAFVLAGSICLFLVTGKLKAQTFDELRKQFPDEKAVLLNRNLEYTINLKDGQPHVESHEMQQIAYLQSAATTYLSDFSFSHSDFQKLATYQAYTRTPDGKKLKVTDFKTSTSKESFVFYDDFKNTTFNFPAVEPGAIGNLEVSWENKEPHLLSPYYFSSYIPVINSQLKLTVAPNVSIKYRLMGLDTNNITIKTENSRGNKIYTFLYKNCPPERGYPDAPGFGWFSPHVIFYIENYKGDDGKTVNYLSNLDDLYKLNYSYIKPINTTISPELKHIVDSLTAKVTSPETKAKNIYNWVQHNIKYVAFEDGMEGFVPRDAGLVCSRRFGDCKDMASILTQMVKAAGIPAYFTWIGTRDLPYKFSEVPLPLVSNHMICTIMLGNKFIFLDGTDPTCVFGTPSYGIQDKEAMISISEKEYKIIKVPPVEKTANLMSDTTWLEVTASGIKGQIKQNLQGYFASEAYGKLMYLNGRNTDESMKAQFARGSNKFTLDSFHIDNQQIADNITLFANFSLPDYAKKIGDEYYLNLNLFKFFTNEQIDYPRRKMPVEYNFKYIKRYVTMLKIPQGYKLSYLPQGKAFHNSIWGFILEYQQKGNYVILTQEFDNETLLLTRDQFEPWNKVLENLSPLYKENTKPNQNLIE
jgi:transglutaminase-like putative cysteine protease